MNRTKHFCFVVILYEAFQFNKQVSQHQHLSNPIFFFGDHAIRKLEERDTFNCV